MATDAQTLLNSSQCYNNYGPGSWPLIEIELLKSWLLSLDAGSNTDPAYLLSQAGCYNNYSAQAWLLKLGLWQNIVGSSAATDPQSLLNVSACYNNYGPGMWPLLYLGLLAQNATGATDVPSLMSKAACDNNYSSQSWLIKLGLLQQISQAVNPTAATDPASLLASANCYNNYGPGLWPLFELALVFFSNNITPIMTQLFDTTPSGNGQLYGLFTNGDSVGTTGLTWNGTTTDNGFNLNSPTLTSVSLPNLVSIDPTGNFQGTFAITSSGQAIAFSLPNFTTHNGSNGIYVYGLANTGIISFPALATCPGPIQINNCPNADEISFPSLVNAPDSFIQILNSGFATISFPALVTCADIVVQNCGTVSEINFDSLTGLTDGSLAFTGNTSLTALNFPLLATGVSNLNCTPLSTAFTSFSAPNLVYNDGLQMTFNGAGLDVASVNAILVNAAAASPALTSATSIDLSGGSNATPTGAGLVAKATLVTNGVVVATN